MLFILSLNVSENLIVNILFYLNLIVKQRYKVAFLYCIDKQQIQIWIYQRIICIDLDGGHYIAYSYCNVRQYILSNILPNRCPKFDRIYCSYKTRCMFCCSFHHKIHLNNLKTETKTKSTIWIKILWFFSLISCNNLQYMYITHLSLCNKSCNKCVIH